MPSPKLLLSNYALRIIKKSSPTPTAQCTGAQHLPSPISHCPSPSPSIHAFMLEGNHFQRLVCYLEKLYETEIINRGVFA